MTFFRAKQMRAKKIDKFLTLNIVSQNKFQSDKVISKNTPKQA
jgi:hypothetical protein